MAEKVAIFSTDLGLDLSQKVSFFLFLGLFYELAY